jgi:bifunctional non-homologous end joining protein LigD
MGLREYRKKRDFRVTEEPAGKVARGRKRRSFVIQHHFASREHYDFRLELDGVLKSWAIPKGPSTVPGERRLAVEVEDHPLEYGSFEGIIPEGQYGAGEVFLWDRGTWDTEDDPRAALGKGSLDFRLSGKKLKGAWTLVRMRDEPGKKTKHNWLLIKRSERPRAAARARAK